MASLLQACFRKTEYSLGSDFSCKDLLNAWHTGLLIRERFLKYFTYDSIDRASPYSTNYGLPTFFFRCAIASPEDTIRFTSA